MRPTSDQEVAGSIPRRVKEHSFMMIGHKIFSTVIVSFPLIQKWLSVSGERMCTSTGLPFRDEACPGKVGLGKLTGSTTP